MNRQTGSSLTLPKLSSLHPDAASVDVVVVPHLHIEGVLSKRALAGELEVVAGEEEGIRSNSREDGGG